VIVEKSLLVFSLMMLNGLMIELLKILSGFTKREVVSKKLGSG
jgi:hypothetical protein